MRDPAVLTSGAVITRRTGSRLAWDVADLVAGEGGTVTVTAAISPTFTGLLTNTASIATSAAESTVGNNAQSTVVRVTCRQDVSRDCVVDVEDITLVADRWRCKMEVLERLAADPALSSIPVLVATARGDSATWVRCLALGARECHAKPISLRRMTASVETHLT